MARLTEVRGFARAGMQVVQVMQSIIIAAEESHRKGWEDAVKHFGLSPKVEDLRAMQAGWQEHGRAVEAELRRGAV